VRVSLMTRTEASVFIHRKSLPAHVCLPRRVPVGANSSSPRRVKRSHVRPPLEKELMLSSITRNWWLAALRGALAVLFGVVALVWPGITFQALVLVFGTYAFIDGVIVF